MIERWFEPFMLLEDAAIADGLGGQHLSRSPVTVFQGTLSLTAARETIQAGQTVPVETLVLLHDLEVTLLPGDVIRREADRTLYRVLSRTCDRCAPAFSGLGFAQVHVERMADHAQ